ncbi:hypothetical protein TSAR_011625 [Trichomalopsis sarcophagae]|uniref:Protein AATF n=1 Tax=Trichomalopsis sarcophagae TaxID=543379 RepID=A0A232F657_9HYME|nr:hypothetical protein TSAR_011625 [Trichomalopsis sarcophagae]
MSSKKKPVSLAEKICNLVTAAPTTFGSDDEAEETKAKVVDYDDEIDENDDFENDFGSSNIRRRNVGLLEDTDKRYKAKKISKKDIFNQDDSSEAEGSMEEDDEDGTEDSADEGSDGASDVDGEQESEEENESDDDEKSDENEEHDDDDDEEEEDEELDFDDSIDLSNPLRRNRADDKGIKTMTTTNVRAEIEKGNCVREQLKLWENLLEMRIKLQKCLVSSNKMPQHDIYKDYASNDDFKKNCNDAKQKISGLLNNLLDLQSNLLNNFPETKGILKNDRKRKANDGEKVSNDEEDMDEEIPSDTEDEMNGEEEEEEEEEEESGDSEEEKVEKKGPPTKKIKLSEFEDILAKNHKAYTEYRNSVIQKWNDKTRIASGVISKGVNQPAVKQIEFALANKEKLLTKTQLKRSEYDIIGKSAVSLEDNDGRRVQEHDTEIYDDDDFYHQLLRELIEYKSADITDPIQLSKQWIQLQNMRSKMKRKIDTRATKGRRIRYNVHQKLVNFMAPITVFDTWTDHAKDELYSSLFGRIKAVGEESKEAKPT